MMSQQPQQHHPQPTTTTTTTTNGQEEEDVHMIWIGDLQNWMDKVEEEAVRTLWIGNLQQWMDEAYINYCFAHTGEVFTSKVIRNKKTNETCYGLILFKSHAIAEKILHRFNGTPMPRVPVGTNFSLNWAATATTDGTTTTTTTGQCEVNCMFCATTKPILTSIDPPTNIKTVGGDDSQFSIEMEYNPSWQDMLKWWSVSQLDGNCTARKVRATNRVYEIAAFLKRPPIKLEDKCLTPTAFEMAEGWLDELQSYVKSINVTKELHSMGALEPLLCNMPCKHAGIGAKAAKVVSTMLQNNPRSYQLVMEAGGEGHLFYTFYCAVDATTTTNVISAISSLFRNNIHITAFRQSNGYADLIDGLHTGSVISQRNMLDLIYCLLLEHKSDCNIITGLGGHHIMMNLASHYCAEVREAALRCLLLLRQVEGGGNNGQLVKSDKLKQVLQKLMEKISAMAQEDPSAARMEIHLLESLWNACYSEPSFLREKGLIVTYEEAPALGPPSAATPSF